MSLEKRIESLESNISELNKNIQVIIAFLNSINVSIHRQMQGMQAQNQQATQVRQEVKESKQAVEETDKQKESAKTEKETKVSKKSKVKQKESAKTEKETKVSKKVAEVNELEDDTPTVKEVQQLAMEAIKVLTGIGATLKGKLLVCDFSDMYFTTIDISKNIKCKVCQSPKEIDKSLSEKLVWLCGRNTANINPRNPLNLELNKLIKEVKRQFALRLKSHLALIFCYKDFEVTLFKTGRMLIKNVDSEKTALEVYRSIFEKLNLSKD